MRPARAFTFRIFLYSAVLLYLAGDLFWFHGPLSRRIQRSLPGSEESIERAKAQGVVARVFGKPIYLSQVERATLEKLWLTGRTAGDVDAGELHETRLGALNDLIDHELLRTKVQANMDELPVTDAEIDEAIRRLAARFATRDEMQGELAAEGIDSEKELRLRLGARIQQQKYIESRIADEVAVSEEEAREWYDTHAEDLAVPDRVHARHIFLATLGLDAAEVKTRLESAVAAIRNGEKTFEVTAAEISDDPRTKERGGDLGWLTRDRLPADFAAPAFRMKPGEPELIRTKVGWHYLEILEARPGEIRSFEEARDEIVAALTSAKRIERARALRDAIRKTEHIAIHIYPDVIPAP